MIVLSSILWNVKESKVYVKILCWVNSFSSLWFSLSTFFIGRSGK